MRVVLKVVIGALIVAIVAIATVPLLVLRDLNSGGTGWGLCPDGLDACSNSYFAGFELVAWLASALFVAAVLLRISVKSLRRVEHNYDRKRAAAFVLPDELPRGAAEGPEADRGAGQTFVP